MRTWKLSLDGVTSLVKNCRVQSRNSLKVGDRVGSHSKLGHDLYGLVEKLNPKKALVLLGNGDRWTVSYPLLFLVMDGMSLQNGQLCIEGEIVND